MTTQEMKREIKFRAWDKIGKQWIINRLVIARILGDSFPKTWELSEYTGLKDKNGKEIYEGDIVKGDICGKDFQGNIIYKRSSFYLKWEKSDEILSNLEHIEVIGNIYENPELLKSQIARGK